METFKDLFEGIEEEKDIECDDLAEKMFDFIELNVDIDSLNEDQTDKFNDILVQIENCDDLEEASKIRKKISPAEKKKRALDYRKNRATLKRKASKYRKTSKFKKYSKKSKRAAKRGKTATGKRQTRFI